VKYRPEVDWLSLGILVYMLMVGDMPFDCHRKVFCDAVHHKSAQFPLYLSRNAVFILNGVSIINMKVQASAVHCSLFNSVLPQLGH
jgi:hypothetical protein